MAEENDVTANKLAEENQVTKKEPQRVTTKKVELGKRLAESNHKKREAKKREEPEKLEKSGVNQYYGVGAVLALGVIGGLGYYIYRFKKGEVSQEVPNNPPQQHPQTNKFEMD